MKTAYRKTKFSASIPKVIVIALGTSLIVTFILTLLGGYLIWNENVPQNWIDIWAGLTRFLAIAAGCIVAMFISDEKKAIMSGIIAAAYMAILISFNILILDGKFGNILLSILTTIGSWAISVVVFAAAKRPAGKKRRIKIR